MTGKSYQQERRVLRSGLTIAAMIVLCASSSSVLAQWTQPDGNGNINSTNTGNVGVGTTAPGTKLTVSSNTQTAPAGLTGTTMQVVGANGVTPRLVIDAFGPVASSLDLRKANNTAASPTAVGNNEVIGQISWQGRGATSYNGGSRAKIIVSAAETYTDTAQGAYMMFQVAPRGGLTAVEAMRIDATGFIGIGTTAPAYRLDVQSGSINASGGLCIAGICKTDWSQVSGSSQWSNGTSSIFYSGGNVGIGTASTPTRKLEVVGGNILHQWSTTAGSEYGFYTAINSNHFTSNLYFDGQWKMIGAGKAAVISASPTNGNAFAVYADNTARGANATASLSQLLSVTMDGKVGVGTGTPDPLARLHLYGAGPFGQDIQTTSNEWTRLRLMTPARTWGFILDGGTGGLGGGKLALFDYTANDWRMVFDTVGNVGIGTISPTEKLEVNGSLKLTGTGNITAAGTIEGGTIKAKYQDVAEWVESSQQLAAGTVVILDPAKSNQVIASTQPYDSHVAGVISLRPGLALGEEGEGRVLVATTGRVKVKVDASNGPINIGDLLVTSDKKGVAMKSIPVEIGGVGMHRPGTLIGKALEPLSGGTGEILVLLSLQ